MTSALIHLFYSNELFIPCCLFICHNIVYIVVGNRSCINGKFVYVSFNIIYFTRYLCIYNKVYVRYLQTVIFFIYTDYVLVFKILFSDLFYSYLLAFNVFYEVVMFSRHKTHHFIKLSIRKIFAAFV